MFVSGAVLSLALSASAELSLGELVDRANKSLRGDSSHGRLTMTIVTPSWERNLEVEGWNLGRQMAFIQVHSPAKDKGNTTLRRKTEMWLWMPRVERVVKIPAAMMHSAWQGSDFTYEDIVKADSVVKDYDHKLLKKTREDVAAEEARRLGLKSPSRIVYEIEGMPKPDAPVVWGRVVLRVGVYDDDEILPLGEEDFSERGELIRTISFSNLRRMGGRLLPTVMQCRPAKKPGQSTRVQYRHLEFDVPLTDSFFSLSRLQKGR